MTATVTLRDGKSIGEKENIEVLGCSDHKPNKDPLEYACAYIKIDSTSIAYDFYPLITTAQLPTTKAADVIANVKALNDFTEAPPLTCKGGIYTGSTGALAENASSGSTCIPTYLKAFTGIAEGSSYSSSSTTIT